MSRSYRRPYEAVTGNRSAKEDKQLAARGMRRKQNEWLRNHPEFEENALVPHRLECAHNDVYGWGRDGKQRLRSTYLGFHGRLEWDRYQRTLQGLFYSEWEREWMVEEYACWPPLWYIKLQRK